MNIVIDSNIFIAALLKSGTVREFIINSDLNLLFPEFELAEIKKYKEEIMTRAPLDEKEFDILLLRLLNYVKIIPWEITAKFFTEAYNIFGKIDEKDVIFIATALAFNCPVWSDDKHFKRQNKVKILTTKEIIQTYRK
jgi:predicted nucleic acid-binding protein